MWMLLEALTGESATRGKDGLVPGIFDKIDKCVEAKGDTVVFHLPKPYPPFMGILAYSSSVIIDKEWAIENNCWDGNMANAAKYNGPQEGHEPLQKITNGTGPFLMKSWVPNQEFVFERFEGYWGEKPKLKRAVIKYVTEWPTRKLMLQNGDCDRVRVDNPYVPEVKAMQGLKLYEVPLLGVSAAFFNRTVNPKGNPYIGSGQLDGQGVPPGFLHRHQRPQGLSPRL